MSYTNLTLELRTYSEESDSHQHDYHQLVLPVKGALDIVVANNQGKASSNKAVLISAGKQHGFSSTDENCFVVANIPASLAPELERLPAFINLNPALAHYASFLHQQLQQGSGKSEKQMLLLLLQLLQEDFGKTLKIDKRIETAKVYLDQHFVKNISLNQLGVIANLSARQLSQLFKQQIGMTPQQYLIEKKMQVAWQLVQQSELSIQQISDRVGYTNISAFSDRFRKHFDAAPSHFRQNGK